MTDAIRDGNHVTSMLALAYTDGVTLVNVTVDSASGGITLDETHTVSTAAMNAARDGNFRTTLMAVDSVSGDPIPLFADPATGGVLVDVV